MKNRLVAVATGKALLLVAALLGCSRNTSTDVAGGGFETSDLQAQVVDTNGVPVPATRVWLLAEIGNFAAAQALDSLTSDSAGWVRFPLRDTTFLGMEAWKGDSLGVVLSKVVPSYALPIRLVLRPSRALVLDCQTFGSDKLLVAGSHFVQTPPPVCVDSFMVLFPSGPQKLLDLPPLGAFPQLIQVMADSLPFWHLGQSFPATGAPPTTGGPGAPDMSPPETGKP